jgi:hypothetical protein
MLTAYIIASYIWMAFLYAGLFSIKVEKDRSPWKYVTFALSPITVPLLIAYITIYIFKNKR